MPNTYKEWWRSKTIWVNVLFLVSMVIARIWGFEISGEEQMAFIIVVNLVLRAFTGSGLAKDKETAELLKDLN